eukprot:6200761-Pleurochrysis_carterae.AAC.4
MMTANQLKVQQASHTRALPAWKHRRIAEENGWRALVRVLLSSFSRLGGGEGLRALLCEALLEDLLGALGLLVLLSLSDGAVLLLQNELDVARRRHVRVGATVGAVGPPALLLRAVHLDVEDLEVVGVEALNLGERRRNGWSLRRETGHMTGLGKPVVVLCTVCEGGRE